MKLREIASIIIVIAIALGFFAAHEASHAVSEKITGQPVTTLQTGK